MQRPFVVVVLLFLFYSPILHSQDITSVGFQIPSLSANPGEEICIDLSATNFSGVVGMEWGLKWDENRLLLDTVVDLRLPTMTLENFNLLQTGSGLLRLSWFFLPPGGLSSDTPLFTLCFTVKEDAAPGFAHITFDETLGGTEIVLRPDSQENPFGLGEFANGGIRIVDEQASNALELDAEVTTRGSCTEEGSTILLNLQGGVAPYSFQWAGPNGFVSEEQNLTHLQPGGYSVTVADASEQIAIGQFWIRPLQLDYNYPPASEGFTVKGTTCGQMDGSITFDNDLYLMTWSTGENSRNLTELAAGTYSVTATNTNNCESEEVFFEVTSSTYEVDFDVQIDYTNCQSTTADVTVNVREEGAFSFLWSTGDSTPVLLDLELGDYRLTITEDSSNCSQVVPVEIEGPPFFSIELEELVEPINCFDSIGVLSVLVAREGNYSFLWNTGANTSSIEVVEPGDYQLTVTDEDVMCSQVFNLEMFVDENAIIPHELEIEEVDCTEGGGALQMTVLRPGEYSYLWNTGDTLSSVENLPAGAYSVTVTDIPSGCTFIKSIDLASIGSASLEVEIDVVCFEENVCSNYAEMTARVMGGSGQYHFRWSTGVEDSVVSNSTIRVNDQRGYAVFVTDLVSGCTGSVEGAWASCLSGLPTEEMRLRLYFTCEEESDTPTSYLHAEVFSGGVPPYQFQWNSGQVDTSFYLSTILFSEALKTAQVTVTDQVGNTTSWAVDRTELYGCGGPDNTVHFEAPHVVVAPGTSFRYPIRAYQYRGLQRGIMTLDWDNCLLRADSLVDYAIPGLNGEPNYVAPAEWLQSGTWEVGFGAWVLSDTLPDTTVIQEIFFTAYEDEEGVSPFVFSINEPGTYDDGSTAFLRPHHGSITVANPSLLVSPGDTDTDGDADHFDLLNLGLLYGASGPDRRLGITGTGQLEYAPPWALTTPLSQINVRHIDCNGDGRIDAADADVIFLNWNGENGPMITEEETPNAFQSSEAGIPFFVQSDSLAPASMNSVAIHLGAFETTEAVYGIAFSVRFDPTAITDHSISMSFDGSWLDPSEDYSLNMYRTDPDRQVVDVALVRTDGMEIEGSGPIAMLHFLLDEQFTGTEVLFELVNVRLINAQEESLAVDSRQTSVPVNRITTSLLSGALDRKIRLFPVPAKEHLELITKGVEIVDVEIWSMDGRSIRRIPGSSTIPVGDLQSGMYLLRISTDVGVAVRKWLKD